MCEWLQKMTYAAYILSLSKAKKISEMLIWDRLPKIGYLKRLYAHELVDLCGLYEAAI